MNMIIQVQLDGTTIAVVYKEYRVSLERLCKFLDLLKQLEIGNWYMAGASNVVFQFKSDEINDVAL